MKDGFKARFTYCGEGYNGDYDKRDPGDKKLLRLDIIEVENGEENPMENGSYCTNVPTDATKEEKHRLLKIAIKLMAEARDQKKSLKRQAEKLSWMDIGSTEEELRWS